jgi:hypothetical protein
LLRGSSSDILEPRLIERNKMNTITKNTQMYKTISDKGYIDFLNINARVLYYKDLDHEYAITINLNNKNNIIDVEQFSNDVE